MPELKFAVFFSGSASSARLMLSNGTLRKEEMLFALTDRPEASGTEFFKKKGIKLFAPDFSDREKFFEEAFSILEKEKPDYVLLSGFMRIIPESIIEKFRYRIVNVHPGDLSFEKNGERQLTGANAVQKAIEQGQKEVKSTIHFITNEVDGGPMIILSKGLKVPEELFALDGEELKKK